MATVTLDHVDKVYSNGFHAVHDLSMDIGEALPVSCGQRTALLPRSVAAAGVRRRNETAATLLPGAGRVSSCARHRPT
jgi:hypothetical protein